MPTVTLPRPRFVYDIRRGEYLSKTGEVRAAPERHLCSPGTGLRPVRVTPPGPPPDPAALSFERGVAGLDRSVDAGDA